jgi:hypothetical protein
METVVLPCTMATSSAPTEGFGPISTQIGTALSIYLYVKKHVVETKWVNWEWIVTRHHTIFNQIKATCDELEMTKMMSFKYDWNNEIIYQFYATLYFDVDGQKLMWITDRRQYEITV